MLSTVDEPPQMAILGGGHRVANPQVVESELSERFEELVARRLPVAQDHHRFVDEAADVPDNGHLFVGQDADGLGGRKIESAGEHRELLEDVALLEGEKVI